MLWLHYEDLVSDREHYLPLIARHLAVPGHRIVFNGPVKTDRELDEAIDARMLLHCDHREEVLRLERRAERAGRQVTLGLRVSLPDSGMSRFGFGIGDAGLNVVPDADRFSHPVVACGVQDPPGPG